HVRVERLLVRNARRAGVIVESTVPGASKDIGLADVLVVGVKGLAEQAGVVVRETSEVSILRSRFENCAGSGILIENADQVTVDKVQIIARANAPMQAGIAIAGVCERPSILRVSVSGQVDTAFEIGRKAPARLAIAKPAATGETEATSPEPTTTEPTTTEAKRPAVRNLVITESRSRGSARAIDFGSCEECVVRSSTFLDSREEVHRIAPPPAGHSTGRLRFTDNLVAWEPGALRRLAFVEPGGEAARLELGPNLWWSAELPVALPRIGGENSTFTGTIDAAQILDIDPVLDNYGYTTSERARGFGAPKP
ncbi:MAG: right-handed parallel beta-helix repeat-containing protein, partial [Planctomycetota bacterium]